MSNIQLRQSDNDPYLYLEPNTDGSSVVGIDTTSDLNIFKICTGLVDNIDPTSVAASISIDPAVNGNISFLPKGTTGESVFINGNVAITGDSGGGPGTGLGNLLMENTITGGDVGVIQFGGNRFVHNYGMANTFVGNTAGNTNIGIGSDNTAIGNNALHDLTSGQFNAASGAGSLQSLTTGSQNCAQGYLSGFSLTTGSQNVAIGNSALHSSTTGSQNVAIGLEALYSSVADTENVAIGYSTLKSLNGGNGNTAVGYNALTAATTGINNVAVGNSALSSVTTESGAVAVGYQALNSMTTSVFGNGLVAVGYQALKSSVTDKYNTAVGFQALTALNGGQYNTAIGDSALQSSTADSNNTALGWGTLTVLNGGARNTAIGTGVGVHMTTGNDNTGCGEASLSLLTSGARNTIIGSNALYSGLTASNNIVIGYNGASAYVAAESSNIVIGNIGTIGDNNKVIIGTQGSGAGQQNACNIAGIYGSSVTAAGTVVIDSSGNLGSTSSFPTVWNDVTSSPVTMTPNNGYVIDNGAALVTLALPAVAALGSRFEIVGKSSGGWTISQALGQQIHFGHLDTTSGAGGSLSSTLQYDCVELICVTANTSFVVKSSIGNLTVV